MLKTIDSRSARDNWRSVVDEVVAGETAVVTRHGSPVVAVIRYQDFLAIQQQLDEIRSQQPIMDIYARYQKDGTPPATWGEKKAHLLAEVQRIKAKNEPPVSHAEVKRRIAAKQTAQHVGN